MPDPTAPIVDAIENLLNEVETLFDTVNQQIQTATYAGDYARIGILAQDAQALRPYRDGLRAARTALREITVPDSVLRSIAPPRVPRVTVTGRPRARAVGMPQSRYQILVLQVLEELGGSGQATDVRNRIHELVKHELTPADYAELPNSPGTIRWSNRIDWARQHLRSSGLLEPSVRQGIWEISAAGRDFLDKARGLDEDDDDTDEIVQEGQA